MNNLRDKVADIFRDDWEMYVPRGTAEEVADTILAIPEIKAGLALLDVELTKAKL